MSEKKIVATPGLPLSRKALRVLRNAGIYAPAMVTVEHQHLAKRYVVRGLEAGGAIADLGRYVTFAGPGGKRIAYLYLVSRSRSTDCTRWSLHRYWFAWICFEKCDVRSSNQ